MECFLPKNWYSWGPYKGIGSPYSSKCIYVNMYTAYFLLYKPIMKPKNFHESKTKYFKNARKS